MSARKELENLRLRTQKALTELDERFIKKEIDETQFNHWRSRLEEYLQALHKQIEAAGSPDTLEEERSKLYEKSEVQKLLTYFLDEKVKVIPPIMDREYGARYPQAEKIMGTSPNDTYSIIEQLAEANILLFEVHSKSLKCPRCRSNNVIIQYLCPYCQFPDFDKSKVIEHFKCHYMDLELKFKKDTELICPNCKSVLKQLGVDYQKHGPWFKCASCQKFFDEPLANYYCGDCNSVFELQQAVFNSLYSYKLNKNFIAEYEKVTIPMGELAGRLSEKGWVSRSPAYIVGVSGMFHQFFSALWFKKKEENSILPIDPNVIIEVITSHSSITSDKVLNFSAKAQDIDCQIKLLVGIPRFESKAEDIAERYGVTILSIKDRAEFVDKVYDFILSREVSEKLELHNIEGIALEKALKTIDEKFVDLKD